MSRLGSLAALMSLALLATPAQAQEATQTHDYDWVFFYYMAYDNNLEACGETIIDMLKKGVTNERTAVLVSADFRDQNGMKRYVLTKDDQKETGIEEEGSAEKEVLASELEWVTKTAKAKKYAVVFLNHGGQLGQMSYDEHPGKAGGKNWLYPPEVGKVIANWRTKVQASGSEVELMFYQQCGKGTLENYYAMKDAAKFVMGSQTVVGAPNAYYTKTVSDVCERPEVDGKEVAALITKHETPNMFTTYSTFDSAALEQIPAKLNELIEPLLAKEELELFKISRSFLPTFRFQPDELMFDGVALFEQLYEANGLDKSKVDSFKTWLNGTLMTGHRVSPLKERQAGTWCGLSIYVPTREQALSRYRSTYSIYADSKLDELSEKVIAAAKAMKAKRSAPKASAPKRGSF